MLSSTRANGDDEVDVEFLTATHLPRDLRITTGAGRDVVAFEINEGSGSILVATGSGDDVVLVDDATFARGDLVIDTGSGNDVVNLAGGGQRGTSLVMGSGDDRATIERGYFRGPVAVSTGAGADAVEISASSFLTALTLDGGAGVDVLHYGADDQAPFFAIPPVVRRFEAVRSP
jgi:hypothetical protein